MAINTVHMHFNEKFKILLFIFRNLVINIVTKKLNTNIKQYFIVFSKYSFTFCLNPYLNKIIASTKKEKSIEIIVPNTIPIVQNL